MFSVESETVPEPSGGPPPLNRRKSKPKRRLRRWILVVLLLLFPLGLLLLNGPGFRTIARFAAVKYAETQGLEGDLRVTGTLWSGFSITDARFRAIEPLGETSATPAGNHVVLGVELGELSVSYRALGLARNAAGLDWLDRAYVDNLTLSLRLPEGAESKKKEKRPLEKTKRKGFNPLWNLLASDIEIGRVNLELDLGDEHYSLGGFALESRPGESGKLGFARLEVPGREPIEGLSVGIEKGEHRVRLGPIELGESATITGLEIAEPSPGTLTAAIEGVAGGGAFALALDEKSHVSLSLREGTRISIPALLPQGEGSPPLSGTISDLDLRFENPFEVPSRWRIDGSIVASGLGVGDFSVESLVLLARENRISLEARHPEFTAEVKVSAPLETADSFEALADLPIDIQARSEVASLGGLVSGFAENVPVEGALLLEARNLQVDTAGNLRAGNILLQGDGLHYDGLEAPTCHLAATVETGNHVRLAADVGLDRDTHLRVSGSFSREDMTYAAEASLAAAASGALGSWLEERHGLSMDGSVQVDWKGGGSLGSEDAVAARGGASPGDPGAAAHEGTLRVALDEAVLSGSVPLEGTVEVAYADTAVDLTRFRLAGGALSFSGGGGWDGKRLRLEQCSLREAEETLLTIEAGLPLDPAHGGSFLEQPGDILVAVSVDHLETHSLTGLFLEDPPLSGRVDGKLEATGSFLDLVVDGAFTFAPHLEEAGENSVVSLDLALRGDVSRPRSWDVNLDALLSGFRWKEIALEDLHLAAGTVSEGERKRLDARISGNQSGTTVEGLASLDLTGSETIEDLRDRPLDVSASIDATDLAALWNDFAPPKLRSFPVAGSLSLALEDARVAGGNLQSGTLSVKSSTFTLEGETFEGIDINAAVPQPNRVEGSAEIRADAESWLDAGGSFHLVEKTWDASLGLEIDLRSGGLARNLLANRNISLFLPRETAVSARAEGALETGALSGDLRLDASELTLATGADPISALKVEGDFSLPAQGSPDLDARLSLESRPLDLSGAVTWHENRLGLVEWKGSGDGQTLFTLQGSLPLDLEKATPELWFSQEDPLELAADIDALPFARIFRLVGREAPLEGTLSLDLDAGGTPASPSLVLATTLADLAVTADDTLPVGEARLTLEAKDASAELRGAYRHPDVNPLEIRASLPFHPKEWALGERKVLDESIEASAKMAPSSLAFLPSQIPAIESIDGTIGIDARVKGLLSGPEISGSGVLEVSRLRLDNRDAPSFYDIDLATRFSDNRLTIDRLYALVAGGEVQGRGSVSFPPGEELSFDLHVDGSEVLVYRTPDLSLRTDVDISLTGPLSRATLAGEIGIVNSRFFKNFDLIPSALPTRNTSALPTVERAPRGGGAAYTDLNLGVDIPPFRDWRSDIRIHTKDPFQVRSNLVESDLVADLHILGTLGAPSPVGFLALDEGALSLPFSSVDVDVGRITFDEKTGFNGAIELRARAKADKYRINAYVYNRVLDPKYVLTSVPPKPTEDLITLIATGTTRDELTDGDIGSMAASKAATLLFKNMRKESAAADREPTLLDELESRTELEIGGVNPETGEHTIGGKVRLWKQLFFVGDVDARNDYRAALLYMFRFR